MPCFKLKNKTDFFATFFLNNTLKKITILVDSEIIHSNTNSGF